MQPLPPSLHVLHAYTRLKMGSNKVSVTVRNMSDSPIFFEEGGRDCTFDTQKEPMSVSA